jgi:hypothetical protein
MNARAGSGGKAGVTGSAAARLAHLGFLLVSPFPDRPGEAQLMVALRDRPTLEHFDPELIRYWRTGADRRGHPVEISRATPLPIDTEFSWGKVELIDRFGIQNEFVTLGGRLHADQAAPNTTVALFQTPGPILRLGGHSQDVDRVALELGAFFGRIMVPIDFDPGVEPAVSAAAPLDRYAAFVAFENARYAAHRVLRDQQPRTAAMLAAEASRLSEGEPVAWQAGQLLLQRTGLAGPARS